MATKNKPKLKSKAMVFRNVPGELICKVKIHAAKAGKSVRDFVLDLLDTLEEAA